MAFTIVVGYDGRPGGRAALDVSLGLAGRMRGTVLFVYVADEAFDERVGEQLREQGEQVTQGALMAAANHRVRAEALVVARHDVAEGLVEVAEARCADLLVVGTHGESPLVGALLGSACHRLVHRTTVPLVVVPWHNGDRA